MEAQAPSPYTGFLQQPWLALHFLLTFINFFLKKKFNTFRYTGRGFFLDPPLVCMCDGVWKISIPGNMKADNVILEDTCKQNIYFDL